MSAAAQTAAVELLVNSLPGINATRYLSAAGVVVLLYDHLLLLGPEIRVVWKARWSYTKGLFLWNRYFVPICLLLNAHLLSGLSTAGLSTSFCRHWLPASIFFGISSLAFANVFIVQRVWALWGRNETILRLLIGVFAIVYLSTFAVTVIVFIKVIPDISYSPFVATCIITSKPKILMAMYGLPMILDVFVFALTCWNAFDRPRDQQTAITQQLVTDGVIYFVCILNLRLFNILVLAIGDVSLTQLGVYFLWAMITVLINRMLILSGTVEVHSGPDPSGRETPFKVTVQQEDDEDDEVLDLYQLPSFVELDRKPYIPPNF